MSNNPAVAGTLHAALQWAGVEAGVCARYYARDFFTVETWHGRPYPAVHS